MFDVVNDADEVPSARLVDCRTNECDRCSQSADITAS